MSWTVSFIGIPEKVALALEGYSDKLTGESKLEYDDALPHMVALVRQNFAKEVANETFLKFNASGHGIHKWGNGIGNKPEQISGQCLVQMESIYGKLLV